MLDGNGNLITSNKTIEKLALNVYTDRLKANEIRDHLAKHEEVTNKLCGER